MKFSLKIPLFLKEKVNILRNFMKVDLEKKFFRIYTGIGAGMYLFMVGGLYAGNYLHRTEIKNNTYEKLSHFEIQRRSLSVAFSWPVSITYFFRR